MSAASAPLPRRQAVRRTLLLLSFIAFPLTMNYFSPYLIVDASFQGILNGSAIVFASMFVGSLLFGRLWCGWACPAAGLQEPLLRVNGRRVGRASRPREVAHLGAVDRPDRLRRGEGRRLQLRAAVLRHRRRHLGRRRRRSSRSVAAYVIYFAVVLLFFGLALAVGRRGGCHTVCWMAPFMILGREARNRLGAWPSLRLVADSPSCTKCGTCTSVCPMSVDVQSMVAGRQMEHPECVLCGTCVDTCPNAVIRYTFSAGQ